VSFKLVLFDIDGTVLDVGGSGRWAMTRAFETVFGIAGADIYTKSVRFDGMTDPSIRREIARNASVSERDLDMKSADLERSFLVHLEKRLSENTNKRVLPGVVELLERLAGVSMAAVGLATGNIERGARLKLASVGLSDYFELGGFGEDADDRTGVARVARQRFEQRLKRPIQPDQVVAVGDSPEDVRAARANGFRSIAVGTGWAGHDKVIAERPDLFVEDRSDYGAVMQFIFGTKGGSQRD